ncbi:MAG: hypothetical protein R3B40_11675 [Polyangiales bacterium]
MGPSGRPRDSTRAALRAAAATGALNKGASQRTGETLKWWMDCTERGGLERFGAGTLTTLHVRWVHAAVRRHL